MKVAPENLKTLFPHYFKDKKTYSVSVNFNLLDRFLKTCAVKNADPHTVITEYLILFILTNEPTQLRPYVVAQIARYNEILAQIDKS
jgi:hypothetical protein